MRNGPGQRCSTGTKENCCLITEKQSSDEKNDSDEGDKNRPTGYALGNDRTPSTPKPRNHQDLCKLEQNRQSHLISASTISSTPLVPVSFRKTSSRPDPGSPAFSLKSFEVPSARIFPP